MSIRLPIKEKKQFVCSNPSCEEEFDGEVVIDDLEHVSSDSRAMGTENQYEFESEVTCPFCETVNEVTGDVWEYPEGTVNSIEVNN